MLAGVDKVVEERDHPREYGENLISTISLASAIGSSPRIRGELRGIDARLGFDGIIPANTGRILSGSSAG